MNAEYSENFKLYGTDGKEILLTYTNKDELTSEINEHITPNIGTIPLYKFNGVSIIDGMMKTQTTLEKLQLVIMK